MLRRNCGWICLVFRDYKWPPERRPIPVPISLNTTNASLCTVAVSSLNSHSERFGNGLYLHLPFTWNFSTPRRNCLKPLASHHMLFWHINFDLCVFCISLLLLILNLQDLERLVPLRLNPYFTSLACKKCGISLLDAQRKGQIQNQSWTTSTASYFLKIFSNREQLWSGAKRAHWNQIQLS